MKSVINDNLVENLKPNKMNLNELFFTGRFIFFSLIHKIKKIFNRKTILKNQEIQKEQIVEIEYEEDYIEKSKKRLNILLEYYNEYELDILKDVYDYTKIVHDSVIDNKIKLHSLEQFHIYYTDNFLSLFEKISENNKLRVSLIQKREEKIRSEIFKLKNDINKESFIIEKTEKIKEDLKKYNEYTKITILSNLDKKICFDSIYDKNSFNPFGEEDNSIIFIQ